jgi:diadenylate cyclase
MLTQYWRQGLEILIIGALLWIFVRLLGRLRGGQLFLEILFGLIILAVVAYWFNLPLVQWMVKNLSLLALIGLLVLFQPELRRLMIEQARFNLFARKKHQSDLAANLAEIVRQLSGKRYGALIALERGMDLDEYSESGVAIDAVLSAELAMTIFHPKTALHDGGMILRNGRIEGAGCVFPVSQKELADRSLGLRHRAAIGLSEETDAVVLIVSEETGTLSLACAGELERGLTPEKLSERLQALLNAPQAADNE